MDIRELQDKVYELEGLIELYLQRDDKREVLMPLIKGKVGSISRLCGEKPAPAGTGSVADSEPESEVEDMADTDPGYPEEDATDDPVAEEIVEREEIKEREEPEEAFESVKTVARASSAGTREKPKFCINDRFRFRRELFRNSSEEFDREMERVSGMQSYEEAEDYFIGILGWDPDNENVMDFLEIMRQYFQ